MISSRNWIKVLLAIAFVLSAEAFSLRTNSRISHNRKSLRLEEAPYPAAGFKPDIPFELPTEIETTTAIDVEELTTLAYEEIDLTTQQAPVPATYLPPQQQPQDVYGPPTEDSTTEAEAEAEPLADSSPEIEQLEEQEFETLPQPEPRNRSGRLSFGRKVKKPIK